MGLKKICLALCVLVLCVGGCISVCMNERQAGQEVNARQAGQELKAEQAEDAGEDAETEMQKNTDVIGAAYKYQNGMVYGEDQELHIERDQIVYARFYTQEDYLQIERAAISREQWEKIAAAVTRLLPVLEALPEQKGPQAKPSFWKRIFSGKEIEITDGPQEQSFALLRQSQNDKCEWTAYSIPQHPAFTELLTCMQSVAAECAADAEQGADMEQAADAKQGADTGPDADRNR